MSNYIPNKEWDLLNFTYIRNVKKYTCCPDPFIDITFTVELMRRSTYFTYTYIAPVAVLSLLGAVMFVLPTGSPEKMTLLTSYHFLVECCFHIFTDNKHNRKYNNLKLKSLFLNHFAKYSSIESEHFFMFSRWGSPYLL